MGYQINYGNHVFAVPSEVTDYYLRMASVTQLRVLLLILRHSESEVTAEQIAGFLQIEEEEVNEAVQFWTQTSILHKPMLTLSGFPASQSMMPFAAPVLKSEAKQTTDLQEPAPPEMVQKSSKDVHPTPTEIAEAIEASSDLATLFSLSEKALGKPLTHTDQCSLLWMHEYLCIPDSVILMLLHYCVEMEKYSVAYTESIAIDWYNRGILTTEAAEAEIGRMTAAHTFTGEIRRMFQMAKKPTRNQQAVIDKWQAAGYPMELIEYAYETTIENIDKLEFKYIDKILEELGANGITDPEQAARFRAEHSPKPKNRRGKKADVPMTEQEKQDMNDYLSLVNRFEEDDE